MSGDGDERPSTLKLGVLGGSGRMGQMIIRLATETPGVALAAVSDRPGSDWIGRDVGEAMGGQLLGVKVVDDPLPLFIEVDAVIDFTTPMATLFHAELAAQARIVHVIGTTGFDDNQLKALDAAARHATIVRAGNMSLGVNLLTVLVEQVARALDESFDIEVVEMHHKHKVDAPSGTALMLGEAAAKGRGRPLSELRDPPRDGIADPRAAGRIGFAALRGGDVVGEHEVVFAGGGERISLKHIASDRALFARGALKAAQWAFGRKPGAYDMLDVLGLKD